MADEKKVARVIATPAAIELIDKLRAEHGDVLFHQSGGCCDGSAPMMFPRNEFMVGSSDVKLGMIAGVPFYMSESQFEYWQHTQLIIDVVPGRGGGFSLEAPEGVRFLSRGRVFTDEEQALLQAAPVITGAAYERGERPSVPGRVIVLDEAAAPGKRGPGAR